MERRLEKKNEDDSFIPFQGLDKGIVLQEKRIFNDTPLNSKKCCLLLTKILYLITQGEKFTKNEATDVFFAVTKLFQSKDIFLRRMVYLVLKELVPMSDDVIIVMSSLTRDMNSKVDLYRANAIRVLTRVIDNTMLGQIERYLKQAIVDKEASVSSTALVSGSHLVHKNSDIVKRWVSEVQEALQSKHMMVQYHALGLLYQIKQQDRLAVSKLVSTMIKSNIRSPYAHCLLIQFTSQVMEEDPNSSVERGYYSYLEQCLRHKSDMVIYEAARAICNLKNVTSRELTPAINVLQLFLSSPKPSLKFSALRTLNKVAQTHPLSVTTCNLDMENLITDNNRSIATLAITTLLKTGNESSVDRLMKQISSFIGEISDEFKIVVVDAIKNLCMKFPQKQRSLLTFLSTILTRDEGGFEYKKAIVDTILTVIKESPESKENGLSHLCEFIEDCEFPYLSTRILNLLGKEGPTTSVPSKYIRYIYNRISLEDSQVRASAVTALAKFGIKLDHLRPSIIILLKRCLNDQDDEVRDRATFYLQLLEKNRDIANNLLSDFQIPIINLERKLQEYQSSPSINPFDITSVPIILSNDNSQVPNVKLGIKPLDMNKIPSVIPPKSENQDYISLLTSIPQFVGLGNLFKSSKPFELTELETEYVVNCVKYIFPKHIIFQFNCTNTLKEQLLENVCVKMDINNVKGISLESQIPLSILPFDVPGSTYVCLKRTTDAYPTGTFSNTLKFIVKEIDPTTGEADDTGYEDEYQLEDIDLSACDYMQKTFINNFKEKWEQLGDEFEVIETYALSTMKNLQDAVKEVTDYLGMQAVEQSDKVSSKKTKHILYLSGTFLGDIPVLVQAKMKFEESQGVAMEMTVRSTSDDVSTTVAAAI